MKSPGTYATQGDKPSWVFWLALILALATIFVGRELNGESAFCECSCVEENGNELCLRLMDNDGIEVYEGTEGECLYYTDQIESISPAQCDLLDSSPCYGFRAGPDHWDNNTVGEYYCSWQEWD